MNIKWLLVISCFLFNPCLTVISQEKPDVGEASFDEVSLDNISMQTEDSVLDAKDWGIRNGCISRSRIRHINFIDDETAIIDIMGRKQVLLTMRRSCRGIKRDGYITYVRGNQLCAKFDRFEVLETGMSCAIGSLEPYIPTISEGQDAADSDLKSQVSQKNNATS
jgi:hypothetical protein